MCEIIYVDFKRKVKIGQESRCGGFVESELQKRLNNIQGSVSRIDALIKELKSDSKRVLTDDELNKLLDDVYTRR